jgi:ankyrin repeat protein
MEKPSGLYEDKSWTGTALHTATFGGHSEIVEILLKHSVDVHASTGVTDKHLAYPASGPTALHIALSVHQISLWDGSLYQACPLPSPGRLQIAQLLVDSGAMVQGVIQHFSLKQVLSFAEFPALWDKLVAADSTGQ